MKIISFSWTTPTLLAGAKTVTRRSWKPNHAARFKAGDFILAYDKSPRAHGRPVALIHLTRDPYFEPLIQMPDSDFEAEGIKHLSRLSLDLKNPISFSEGHAQDWFNDWRNSGGSMWVVRFKVIARVDHLPPFEAKLVAKEYAEVGFHLRDHKSAAASLEASTS